MGSGLCRPNRRSHAELAAVPRLPFTGYVFRKYSRDPVEIAPNAATAEFMLRLRSPRIGLLTLAAIVSLGIAARGRASEPTRFDDRAREFYARQYSPEHEQMKIPLPRDWAVYDARLEFTPHGHGVLKVGNFSLRVFDGNPDPIMYQDSCLNVRFLRGDHGERLIVVSGIVLNAERNEHAPDQGFLLLVYAYDPRTRHARKVVSVTPFASEGYLLEQL